MNGPDEPTPGSAWGLSDAAPAPGDALHTPEDSRYVPTGLVGAGGMGVVEAVHDRRLDREVARKMPAPGLDDRAGLALLAHEARITARLDHPNVVAVHDAGRTPDGRSYFTMRLVRGSTLSEVLRAPRSRADLPRLLRHLLDACRALGHAHALGIVHGDLKPGNVLVGPLGEAQVADWGLARFLDPAEPAPPTASGAGTPPWRAPEVEAGELATRASDVYALGVLLRELLSGDPSREPDAAPVDLLAVMRRATSAAPADRYPDATALGEDLERWLDGQPVLAHAYSPREMLTRLVRTWRVPIAVGAIAVVALAVTITVGTLRTSAERDRAVAAERSMRDVSATLWSDRALAALKRDDRPEAERAARASLALAPSPTSVGVLAAFGAAVPAELQSEYPLPACGSWIRFVEAGALCGDGDRVTQVGQGAASLASWDAPATDAIARADGTLALLLDGRIESLDPKTGARATLRGFAGRRGLVPGGLGAYVDREHVIPLSPGALEVAPCGEHDTVDGTATSADGTWWAVCGHGTLVTGDAKGHVRELIRDPDALRGVVVLVDDPASQRLLGGAMDGALVVIDKTRNAVVRYDKAGLDGVRALAVGGALVATVDDAGHVWLWRASDGASLGRLNVEGVRDVRWSGGHTLWIATTTLQRWRVPEGLSPYRWNERGGVSAMALSPNHDRLAVGSGATVSVRTLDGAAVTQAASGGGVAKALAFTTDGDRLAWTLALGPQALRWLDPADGQAPPETPPLGGMRRLVQAADDRFVAIDYGRSMVTWVGRQGAPTRFTLPSSGIDLVADRHGTRAWVLDGSGGIRVVDLLTQEVTLLGEQKGAQTMVLYGDGERLAVATSDHVKVFSTDRFIQVASWDVHDGLTALAFAPHGPTFATGHGDGVVTLRSAEDGSLLWSAPGHSDLVSSVLYLNDHNLLTGSWDGTVRRWSEDPLAPPPPRPEPHAPPPRW